MLLARHLLSLVSVITHRHLCPRHLSLSLLSLSRRLASLSGGVWPHSLCLVRVTHEPFALARASLSLSLDVPLVSRLASLSSLRALPRALAPVRVRHLTSLSRLLSIAGQPAFIIMGLLIVTYIVVYTF